MSPHDKAYLRIRLQHASSAFSTTPSLFTSYGPAISQLCTTLASSSRKPQILTDLFCGFTQ